VLEQPQFLNLVVRADTTLASLVLLERAQAIENAYRRTRDVPGGPRTLDVDLIVVGERVKNTPVLTLPHPRAHERAFVLAPWLDIEPAATVPERGPVAGLLAGLGALASIATTKVASLIWRRVFGEDPPE